MSPRVGRQRVRWTAALTSLAFVFLWGCGAFDDYWDKDEDAFLGPPPDLTPPLVRLLSPSGPDSAQASPAGGRDFSIEIEASDDHRLERVELHIDDQMEGLLVAPPFRFRWDTTPLEDGSVHAIWALATDDSDNTASSDTVYAVVFNSGPQITLSTPVRGALVTGDIQIAVEPNDPRVPIDRVDFLIDGLPIGSASSSPFEIVWDSSIFPPGDHFLSAMAFGEEGLGIAPFVSIALNNSPPRVELTFPSDGKAVAPRGTVPFSATAVDTVHGAIGDSLVWESDLDGRIGQGPYFRTSDLSVGVHRITVGATNAWGLSAADEIQLVVKTTPTYSYCFDLFYLFVLNKCYPCHNPGYEQLSESEFDMSSINTMRMGGKSLRELGLESLVPCKPESSLVWIKIIDDVPPVGNPMPPPGDSTPLLPDEIERIRIWIDEGAPPDEGLDDGC